MSDLQIRRLEAENEILRDRVAVLEELLFARVDNPLPAEWRLSPAEEKLFRALLRRPIASRDYLNTASAYDYASDDLPEPQIVNVRISKMRPKLRPFGIEIVNHWGRGYSLDEAVRERFKALGAKAA